MATESPDYDISDVSPRPWRAEGDELFDADDDALLDVYGPGGCIADVNAAHIVHCVNTHDGLVAENERLKGLLFLNPVSTDDLEPSAVRQMITVSPGAWQRIIVNVLRMKSQNDETVRALEAFFSPYTDDERKDYEKADSLRLSALKDAFTLAKAKVNHD